MIRHIPVATRSQRGAARRSVYADHDNGTMPGSSRARRGLHHQRLEALVDFSVHFRRESEMGQTARPWYAGQSLIRITPNGGGRGQRGFPGRSCWQRRTTTIDSLRAPERDAGCPPCLACAAWIRFLSGRRSGRRDPESERGGDRCELGIRPVAGDSLWSDALPSGRMIISRDQSGCRASAWMSDGTGDQTCYGQTVAIPTDWPGPTGRNSGWRRQ